MTGVSHQALVGGSRKGTMIEVINSLGIQSGLKLCLDAGDAASYTSGQSWLDRSGNGYDFFRGTTSASQATDPTFNGVAGAQSSAEYWSFDGADYFTYDTTNETWMDNLHKNNAKFAFATWAYIADRDAERNSLMGTAGGSLDDIGVGWFVRKTSDGGQLKLVVDKGSGGAVLEVNGATVVPEGQWQFLVVSVDEALNTGFLQVGATQDSISTTYSSPSSAAADYTFQIGDSGAGGAFPAPILSGGRMNAFLAWEGTIPSAANLVDLYNATKGKFGL